MYNKLFTKILDSSIWLENHPTRIVWMTMLAVMDEDGMCQFASVANLARRAIVTLEEARHAIHVLENPDQESSDPENEGRRIERVPGGWMVLNSLKYREQVTRDEIRRKTRERVARYRARKKPVTTPALPNSKSNGCVTEAVSVSKAEADTGAVKAPTAARGTRLPKDFTPSERHHEIAAERRLDIAYELEKFRDHFIAAPGQKGVKLDWPATFRNWLRNAQGGTNGRTNGHHRPSRDEQILAGRDEIIADIDAREAARRSAGGGRVGEARSTAGPAVANPHPATLDGDALRGW